MARWTSWRRIADRDYWYEAGFDWDGPACYQLAIGGPRGGGMIIVYVGETKNERQRLIAYARHGSHLSEIITEHLKNGWHLFYRARAAQSKKQAVVMQNKLLLQRKYDWNIHLNTWGK